MRIKQSYLRRFGWIPLTWGGLSLFLFQNCGKGFSTNELTGEMNRTEMSSATTTANKSCGQFYDPGHAVAQRLTNTQYNNTVRDLLYTSQAPADQFPPDVRGRSGYTNDSTGLTLSQPLIEKYLAAAQSLADEVIASKSDSNGAYRKIAPCGISIGAQTQSSCIEATVRDFGARAYRRPLSQGTATSEATQLINIFNQGSGFDEGLRGFLIAVLINPKFLFLTVMNDQAATDGSIFALSDYELASRLSYFIWQTLPDQELTDLAASGRLHEDDILHEQVQRLLKDPRSRELARLLRDEWLGISKITTPVTGLDDGLRQSMIAETDAFLQDLFQNDRSFIQMFTADYGFVNSTLARHYGMAFNGSDPNQVVKTSYKDGRLGVLSQAAFLTANSGLAAEVSTVKRGHALSNSILCLSIGSPPPDAPTTIDADPNITGNPREKLTKLTSPSRCIGCHQMMNPLGFGLNQFSTFGQLRSTYATSSDPIDTSGSIPNLISFGDGKEMLQKLPTLDAVKTCFPRQMMAIATSRAPSSADDWCVQQAIGQATSSPQSKMSDLITAVVQSRQFRMQSGEAP